jgi:acylphosphatase
LIRARIVVEGDVQKVGYRDFVQKVARKLGVKGYVENLRDGNVQIICEAEEAVLNGFVEGINVKDDFVKVEKVRVVERSEATGEFDFFEIKYGRLADELGERLGTAVVYAGATRQDIKEMHVDLKGSIEGMHTDLKGSIKEMHKDLKDGIVGVQSEIRGMRGEMNERFDEMAKRYDAISSELVRTREELTRAVEGLLKLIEEFIRQRRGEKGQ